MATYYPFGLTPKRCAEQPAWTIPIYDKPPVNINNTGASFSPASLDAVIATGKIRLNVGALDGRFNIVAANAIDFTNNAQINFDYSVAGDIGVASGNVNTGGGYPQFVALNKRLYTYNGYATLSASQPCFVTVSKSNLAISPNANRTTSSKIVGPTLQVTGTHLASFGAYPYAQPIVYQNPLGKIIAGALYRSSPDMLSGYFIGDDYTIQFYSRGYNFTSVSFRAAYPGLVNMLLSTASDNNGGIGRHIFHPMTPLLQPYTVLPDNPAYQYSYPSTMVSLAYPFGFLTWNAFNYSYGIGRSGANPCIISPDGLKYWPVKFDPKSTAAANALNSATATFKIDQYGVAHLADTNGTSGYYGNNVMAAKPQMFMNGLPVNSVQIPLVSFSLPCVDYCRNPSISIGRKQ